MTISFFPNLQMVFTVACLLMIVGCEEPTRKAGQVTPPVPKESPEKKASNVKNKNLELPDAPAVKKDSGPKKPEYPYFAIYKVEGGIVVKGALKSKIQIEDIIGALERSFPKLTIKNELEREFHRHAVGWGNRVGGSLLVDYFTKVKDPAIEYKEGIITLKGSVRSSGVHREVSELAITAFADTWTDDLVNEITVRE